MQFLAKTLSRKVLKYKELFLCVFAPLRDILTY